ncbi:cytochrome o ubiquinol oxidase subunit 2 [Primorskyibacter sedentarius]|uniref:Cytochrome o ubiquinol oxidase subunit 2 n=1 Tax=Primorskyibacter sedentarius TaxID=745311 RepID=A0A4R3IW17_9RHOB|nr:cytochrome ubiquinol oxidase subunit II [Primorskyibacter sedentarius]TCS54466.1 cytochrome o ubiquinol oxidase subunit 2 [Primorskyibacter sedentarius]
MKDGNMTPFSSWRFRPNLLKHAWLLCGVLVLSACNEERNSFLDPAGPIAAAQRTHMFEVIAWTMIAIVPVFVFVPLILWRYRFRNAKARYTPDWEFSGWLDMVMWGVPFVIIIILSSMLWKSTHALDPYKPIASTEAPVNVQVVGLDWKWLFIYPDLGIATVNELVIPVNASVAMDITTDTVMQSILISSLAGQIYAMPGMRTKLHVLADETGTFVGENTQYNGDGFVDQNFQTISMSTEDFAVWVTTVKASGVTLDATTYGRLAVGSTGAQAHETLGSSQMPEGVIYFNQVEPSLFETVLGRYNEGTDIPPAQQPGAVGYVPPSAQGANQ